MQDCKLGFRMLVKYPGLTLAGGLALAIAIGIGAGWYDFIGDLFRPTVPLPEGERIVEVEMRNPVAAGDERRLLHDFVSWRKDLRLIEDLGAYRTLERNLILGDARPEPVTVAEITASAFRVVRVPPLLGRPLLDADEQPGAPPVVVLGYSVWQRQFGGRTDAIGRTRTTGKDDDDGGGRHASGLRFSGEPQAVGAASTQAVGVRAARGRGDPGVRPARARRHPGASLCGSHRTGRTHGGRLSADASASSSARVGVRRRVSR